MNQTFKLGYGRGARVGVAVGSAMELVLAFAFFSAGLFWFGLGIVALTLVVGCLVIYSMRRTRYEISDSEILVRCLGESNKRYLIDKIQKIQYIDINTEWARYAPNCRFQLAVYFERSYFKSVEPRYFGPSDRDAFVDAILKVNPDIQVNRDDIIV